MAVDPVPLAIGGGALHTDDLWRVAANAFTNDTQGVVGPGQCKVTALGTPGAAVSVAAGGLVIRNAQFPGQSYIARVASPTQVSIAANAGGSVRRDLLLARIIDPDFSPWQPSGTPGQPNTSVANGPYFDLFVVSGVAAGTTTAAQAGITYSAYPLARIEVTAGASAVTSAMIAADLRELASARAASTGDVQMGPNPRFLLTTAMTTFTQWPLNTMSLTVPRWATHAQVTHVLNNVRAARAGDMERRVVFGGTAASVNATFDYNGADWANAPADYTESFPHTAYAEFDVRAIQGQTAVVSSQARRTGFTTGDIWVDYRDQVIFEVKFTERVV